MKTVIQFFRIFLLSSLIFTSCEGDKKEKKESSVDSLNYCHSADSIPVEGIENVEKTNKATCSIKEKKNEYGGEPTIIKTCLYKNYKSISIGEADYKGRYTYSYVLYKKENNKFMKIENESLFNKNRNKLLSIINTKFQNDYKEYSLDPESKYCFEGTTLPNFSFKEIGIEFDDDKIRFNVSFGLPSACMAVDGSTVSFNFDEIQGYLNE